MFRKNVSRCNYLLTREYGARVSNTYDFVLEGIKRSCSPTLDTNTDLEFWRSPVFASNFCPMPSNGSLLAAANEIGKVLLWDVSNDTYENCYAVNTAHDNAIFDMAWSPVDLRMVTASGDKSVVIWNCNPDLKLQKLNTFTGHNATAKTCAWSPDNPATFCTGDRSGVLFVWDTRTGKAENCINIAHERVRLCKPGKRPHVESASITGIVFYQPHYLITSAASTEKIRMWDLRKYYAAYSRKPQPLCEISHSKFDDQCGYAYLTIDRARHRLYASNVYDRIYSFALNTPDMSPAAVFTGGVLRSFYSRSCLSPDGKYLVSGSSTEKVVIWSTNENTGANVSALRKIRTSGLEVNTVAWCSGGDHLKIAAFPENEPCEIYSFNSSNVSRHVWDCDERNMEDLAFQANISRVESDLPPMIQSFKNSRFTGSVSNSFCKSEMASPTFDNPTCTNLFISAGQNKKRVLQEMLENDSEDRQNKKFKLKGDSSTELIPYSEDDEKSFCQFTSPDTCVKTPFSPTSNLPNHAVDGTSPSHICKSYRKKRLDWLTELRHGKSDIENNAPTKMVERNLCKNEPSKNGKISDIENNAPMKTVERNLCKNEPTKKSNKKGHESILKFFRVLGKSTDEQLKYGPGCRVISNNQSL